MHAHYRTNLSYRMSICAPIVYILCERFNYVIGRDNDPCRPWIICLAQPQKGVKEGRPSGPSPHVRVTQQCKATSSLIYAWNQRKHVKIIAGNIWASERVPAACDY